MKKLTKLFLAALALTFSVNLAAQEEVVYTSSGYDVNAQKMVNFTWNATDGFLSVDAPAAENLSAKAYKKGNQLYTLAADGNQQTISVMDCETFEQKSQVSGPQNAVTGLPIVLFANEQYPVGTYAIASAKEEGVGTRYFTAVLDEKTAELKRITTIGYWYDDEAKTSIAPLTFFFSYGNGYMVYAKRQGGETKVWLGQLNLITGVITETGVISVIENVDPTKAVASIYYLSTTYRNYLVISPDGVENSSIYYLPTFASNGVVASTLETTADRVLANCYQRPSTVTTYGNPTVPIAVLEDLNIAVDGTKITVTFTMPSTDRDGNTLTPDDWALTNDYSRSINVNVYMENSSVTMTKPAGVNYFFPGDQVTLTGDLSNIYGITNPNGIHCFTVRTQPSNGYSGKTYCDNGYFALVGGAKPEPVSGAKVVKSGDNSGTFSWNAPTATEYADWGYAFDGSNLSYTIVRNIDGVVVAEGITDTTAEVDNLAKEPGDYDFSVYAVASGTQSAPAMTNAIYCQPPTYAFLGYNLTTSTMVAFNMEEAFGHTDWMQNNDIQSEVGFVRGSKLYTAKYNYSKASWGETNYQTFGIFTAEKLERQGYNTSNYWYTNQKQIVRHLIAAAYSPEMDRAFGVAVDSVRNADGLAVALNNYVIDIDTVASYQLQNRIVDALGQVSLEDPTQDAKAIVALAFFQGQGYAAVVNRQGGNCTYELALFNPMTQELSTVGAFGLPIALDFGRQFFVTTADKLYLGYNDGQNNTVLYEVNATNAQLTKIADMDGVYSYAYQKPSMAPAVPALADMAAATSTINEETGAVSFSVTLPATTAEGEAINGKLNVSVLFNGVQTPLVAEGQPGATIAFNDLPAPAGLHLGTIVATDAEGRSSNVAATAIVGPAKPNGVTNALAEMFDDNAANITWTAPTTSIWADFGGTIKESDELLYIVVQKQEGTELVNDCVDAEYYADPVASTTGSYNFVIYAVNGTQQSIGVETNFVEVTVATGISAQQKGVAVAEAIYDAAGRRTDKMQRGINIVKTTDGRTVKVMVKD